MKNERTISINIKIISSEPDIFITDDAMAAILLKTEMLFNEQPSRYRMHIDINEYVLGDTPLFGKIIKEHDTIADSQSDMAANSLLLNPSEREIDFVAAQSATLDTGLFSGGPMRELTVADQLPFDSIFPEDPTRATELEYLKWFRINADFGPGESDYIDSLNQEFMRKTKKNLTEGWNVAQDCFDNIDIY